MTLARKSSVGAAAAVAALLIVSGTARAQSAAPLLLPGYPIARDVPGAKELPDPSLTYKVLFDVQKPAPKLDDVNPGLLGAARYLNTLAKYGVPADHRKIVVVLHGDAAEIITNNDTFKARNQGHDNPNIAIIQAMKKAGVDFRVCGQAVLGKKIDPKTIVPEIQINLWALTTMTTLELRGYVHVGG